MSSTRAQATVVPLCRVHYKLTSITNGQFKAVNLLLLCFVLAGKLAQYIRTWRIYSLPDKQSLPV